MKAVVNIAEMATGLARIKSVVAGKSTLPVLACVRVTAGADGIELTGTDLDCFLSLTVPAAVEEGGAVVVSCARLQAAVGKIEGGDICLSTRKAELIGESGSMRFELLGLDPAEFPAEPEEKFGEPRSFAEGALADGLGRELGSVSTDETRYVLNGIHLAADKQGIQMVATDGRRLALTVIKAGAGPDFTGIIVPTLAAKTLACLDGGGATELRVGANHIAARGKGWRFTGKLIEGNYPNWKQVVPPEGGAIAFTAGRERLIEAVRFAATICTKAMGVKLEIRKGALRVLAVAPDVGQTFAEVPVEASGGDLETAFNPGFLLVALMGLQGDEVGGEIADGQSPLRLTDGTTVSVLMPMRIV